jgi:hypothetical protein
VAELENLTAGILLSPWRMSTVKIRARSLFRTPRSRIGAGGAGSGHQKPVVFIKPRVQWPVTSDVSDL